MTLCPGQRIRPNPTENSIRQVLNNHYGMKLRRDAIELNSYDDRNYHVFVDWLDEKKNKEQQLNPNGYVLKIINSMDTKNERSLEGQNQMMLYLNERGIKCTVPMKNLQDKYLSFVEFDTIVHAVKLLVYQTGEILHKIELTKELLSRVGELAGTIDGVLKGFHHPGLDEYKTVWSLKEIRKLRDFIHAVQDANDRIILHAVIDQFEKTVIRDSRIDLLEQGFIHGDLNPQNIIVDGSERNVAVIDFGDTHRCYYVFELAVCLAYMILQCRQVDYGKYVIRGYRSVRELNQFEEDIMKILVCARLAQSLILGCHSFALDGDNDYLLAHQKDAWRVLKLLWGMGDDEVKRIWFDKIALSILD